MSDPIVNSSQCPEPGELEAYLAGTTGPEDTATLRAHLDGCADCRSAAEDHELLDEIRSAFGRSEAAPTSPVVIAERIPGYEGFSELQRGNQGVVFRAVQQDTNRAVAIKLMLHGAFATERQRHRFQREVELAARLRHPHIVTIYGSGECREHHYYVMEFVDGLRLDQHVRECLTGETPRLRIREVAELIRKVAAAVGHAHANGIIHRDLKPANILVDAEHEPHILDFGLARQMDVSEGTQSGEFLGTMRYASPEQAAADPDELDIRTDVYSLGLMLYEALTGEMPYDISGPLDQVIATIRAAIVIPPARVNRDIDSELETIVLKALSPEKSRRYQSAEELSRDIGHYLAGEPIDARRDSQLYLAKKLLSRYRYVVATSVSVFVIVCASLILSLVMLRRASIDRDTARTATADAVQARLEEQARRVEVEKQRRVAEFNSYAACLAACDSAIRVGDISEAAIQLQRAPEAQRDFEWWHIQQRVDASVRTFAEHQSYVEQVIALRTRPWVVSICWGRLLVIRDRTTGELVVQRELPESGWCLATNASETRLAVGAWDGTARVWTLPDLEPVCEFRGAARRVMKLAFNPLGTAVAAAFWAFDNKAESHEVVVADAESGEVLSRRPLPGRPIALSFASQSRLFCSCASSTTVVDPQTGEQIQELPYRVLAVSSKHGRLAVAKPANAVAVHAIQGFELICDLVGHTDDVLDVCFADDGRRVATTSADQSVRVWNAETGELVRRFTGHQWKVTSVDFVPDSDQLVSASWDQSVRLWDLTSPREIVHVAGHDEAITCLTLHPKSGVLATASRLGDVKLWQLSDMQVLHEFADHTQAVQDVAFTDDGERIAAACWDGTITVRDIHSEDEPTVLKGHTDLVLAVRFVPESRLLLSGSRDNTIRVWNTDTGELIDVLEGHKDHIHTIRFHPDGSQFASAGHSTIHIWDTQDRELLNVITREIVQEDYSLEYDPTGKQLAAGTQRHIGFWDPKTGDLLQTVLASRDEMRSVSFSPTGKRLVSVSVAGVVRVWDVPHRTPLVTLRDAPAEVRRAVFAPDGKSVIGGLANGRILFWRGRAETNK